MPIAQVVVTAVVLHLHCIQALGWEWRPKFTAPSDVRIRQTTLALFTHCSRHFDPLNQTHEAVNRTVRLMKERSIPVIYLHERENPASTYHYQDHVPTAVLESEVGNIDIDFSSVRHVFCLGGYFGQCERNTVSDVVRLWQRDCRSADFRITQVVDGIFCVTEHVQLNDSYAPAVRGFYFEKLRSRNQRATMAVDRILDFIPNRDLQVDYLTRQLPELPLNVNIVVDCLGYQKVLHKAGYGAPTLTMAYCRSQSIGELQQFSRNGK